MGDSLERYIIENREQFDQEEPSDELWQRIQKKRSNHQDRWSMLWKIAAMLFMVSTVILMVERNLGDTSSVDGMEPIMTEFSNVEDYYIKMIAEKKVELSKLASNDLKRGFLIEIERLDEQYEQLKMTYEKQNASEMVTDAMISNLKMRIEILNKQLEILKELKRQKEDETNTFEI